MKLTIVLSTVLTGMLLCAGRARAEVVTFDDLSDNGLGTPITGTYPGLTWTNFGVLNTTLFFLNPSGYQNGTVSAPNVAFNEGGLSAMTMGSAFTFNSAYFTGAWNTA